LLVVPATSNLFLFIKAFPLTVYIIAFYIVYVKNAVSCILRTASITAITAIAFVSLFYILK